MAAKCLSRHATSPWLLRFSAGSSPTQSGDLSRTNFLLDTRIHRLIMCVNITRGCKSFPMSRSAQWFMGHKFTTWKVPCSLPVPCLAHQSIRGAGHSKWQNIRHTKAGKDAEKAKVAAYITRKIRVAIKEGGSSKPEANVQLARAIEEGRKKDIPISTMQLTIKKLEKSGAAGSTVIVELKGVGNCLLLVEAFTDNAKHFRTGLQGQIKKVGATVVKSGMAMHSFEQKGVIEVPFQQGSVDEGNVRALTEEEATELAIDAGAEEIISTMDEVGGDIYQFLSDPSDLHVVMRNLEVKKVTLQSAQLQYLPTSNVQLSDSVLELAGIMLDRIMENDDVVKIYHNIQAAV